MVARWLLILACNIYLYNVSSSISTSPERRGGALPRASRSSLDMQGLVRVLAPRVRNLPRR